LCRERDTLNVTCLNLQPTFLVVCCDEENLDEAIGPKGGTVEEERKDLQEEMQDEEQETETEPHSMSSPSSISSSPSERNSMSDPSSSSEPSSPSSS
jgi:hypothetical protein